jgi:antitoxin HicB
MVHRLFSHRFNKNAGLFTYKIMLHKEPEGQYTATVPALPGCVTYGENVDHAISMAKEAIELYIEFLEEKGEEIPDDNATLEYSLNLTT